MSEPQHVQSLMLRITTLQIAARRQSTDELSRRRLFAGWDVARKRDLSVVWILELLGDVLVTRWREEMLGVPFPIQYDFAELVMRLPGLRRMNVDQTGMGGPLFEFLQRKFGSARVGGVTFTGPARVELANHLKARFADRRVRIPSDPFLRDDLRLVKKEDTLSSERIVIDESGESHADRFWAIALANYAHFETTAATGTSPGTAASGRPCSTRQVMKRNPAAAMARRLLSRAS